MKLLIFLLIIFFIILIVHQIFFTKIYTIEGLANSTSGQYQPYNTNNSSNAGILAQQNAGNIQVLEGQVNNLTNLQTEVTDISGNMATITTQINNLQSQVNALMQQQQTAADNVNKKLPVTGATS
jgi:hypothetical protein